MLNYLVCYADTDAGGVMHHARYIELAEHGYHHWLRQRGLSCRNLGREHALSLVVHEVAAKYRRAVLLEDEIRIDTRLHAVDRKGLEWQTTILKDGALAFSLLTKMVCLGGAERALTTVPGFLIERLADEVGVAMFAVAE